jgi:hypothetical protein
MSCLDKQNETESYSDFLDRMGKTYGDEFFGPLSEISNHPSLYLNKCIGLITFTGEQEDIDGLQDHLSGVNILTKWLTGATNEQGEVRHMPIIRSDQIPDNSVTEWSESRTRCQAFQAQSKINTTADRTVVYAPHVLEKYPIDRAGSTVLARYIETYGDNDQDAKIQDNLIYRIMLLPHEDRGRGNDMSTRPSYTSKSGFLLIGASHSGDHGTISILEPIYNPFLENRRELNDILSFADELIVIHLHHNPKTNIFEVDRVLIKSEKLEMYTVETLKELHQADPEKWTKILEIAHKTGNQGILDLIVGDQPITLEAMQDTAASILGYEANSSNASLQTSSQTSTD